MAGNANSELLGCGLCQFFSSRLHFESKDGSIVLESTVNVYSREKRPRCVRCGASAKARIEVSSVGGAGLVAKGCKPFFHLSAALVGDAALFA